jgi:hypothetical protein
MPKLTAKALVLAKTEVSEGVDSTPAATNAVMMGNITVEDVTEKVRRTENFPHLSPTGEVIASRYYRVTFETPVRNGSGSPGVVPREDALFRAAGASPTVVAGTSVTYTPSTPYLTATANVTTTLYAYMDDMLLALNGCRANAELFGDTSTYGRIRWTVTGRFNPLSATPAATDGIRDASSSGTFENLLSVLPQPCINNTINFNIAGNAPAVAKIIQSINFNMGNDVQPRPDMGGGGGVNGIYAFLIRAREGRVQFNPEAVSRSTYDFFYKAYEQLRGTFQWVIGSTPGNIVTFNASSMALSPPRWEDRNGVRVFGLDCLCSTGTSAGDDEWSIVLT